MKKFDQNDAKMKISQLADLIEQIDSHLPQTQCQLCTYKGCRPYAEAIVYQGETIDRCLPGGAKTLTAIAQLLDINPEPYINTMTEKFKAPTKVVIRENECIGCTKCIQACPVDAIIGASKQMHTVIQQFCTGCDLCIPVCPVDCIDIIANESLSEPPPTNAAEINRQRYQQHQIRIEKNLKQEIENAKLLATPTIETRKINIQAAVARAKAKRIAKIENENE